MNNWILPHIKEEIVQHSKESEQKQEEFLRQQRLNKAVNYVNSRGEVFSLFRIASLGYLCQSNKKNKLIRMPSIMRNGKEGRKWKILCVVRGLSTLFARD